MGDRRRPGGPATENAGAGTPASGGPAIPAPRSGTNEAVRGGPGPGRNAQQTGSSDRQQNGEASNVSASNSPSRDSDRQQNGNASSSSKKRKRISARSYFKKFKMAQGGDAAGVASDDKENTSSGHVADSNIYKLCEGSRLIGKNKRQSSDTLSKVSERLVSDLHETSETVVKQGSEPSSEAGATLSPPLQQHDDTQQKEEPISIQPMENEPVETSVGSRGGLASEAVDFSENIISCNSDDIGVESADSIGQEASTCRNTEHIVKPSMLLGGATSLVRGVNSNNDGTMDTDGNHLDSPILASSQSFISMVGAQSVLPCMSPHQSTDLSAQQNVAPSRCPPVEAEHTGVGTQEIQVLQPEMQPSILFPDAPLQKISDDRSQTGFQPDRATGLPQGAAETSLHLGDARMQGQGKSDGNVAVDPLLLTYPADSPVTVQVSTEVETQTCEPTMPATQSTNPPAQQNVLGTEAASDLHPNVQPSISMQDEPEEAEDEPDAVDEPAEAERAATLGVIAAQTLQPETQSSTSTQDVLFERTYLSGMPVLHSPTIHQSVEPSLHPHGEAESVGMVTAHDLQSKILLSAPVPVEQNTSLLSQQSLATSQHSPAEAEPADILCTKLACDLQPSLVEVHDQPAEEQSCILRTIAARNLQPETQPSTSMQNAPFGKTHLFVMSMLQNLTAHRTVEPSLDPHGRPAEAEGPVMLGSTTAHDVQAEVQLSTKVQPVPLERIRPEERRQIGFLPNMVSGIEQPTHHPPARTLVFNNPILSDDRLKNELHTLMHSNSLLSKDHEHKKALLLIECNQEIEKIKKKYASLLQKEESTYVQALRDLTDIYRKGLVEKSLADNFQGQITPPAAPQGSPVMEHASEPSSAAEPSSIWNAQPQSILAGHLYGMTSSPLVPAPAPNGSEGSAGAQLHASAPLLQHLRMPWAHAVHTDQQQLPPASPPLGQYAPVIMGSYASTVPWGGNANMSAALRHAATRLGGGPLRAEQRQLVSSVVAKVSRPVTEAEHDHVCNQIKQIEEKKEELYIMIADLTRSYKVPRKIAHRNAMVMDQLAPQVQPRPNDQIWVASRRAQRLDYFLTHVGWWTLGAGTAHGLRWTFDQIDPDINKSIAVEMHKLREKMEKMMR
ncbi:hypothetical protein ACQ4PT_039247 [Festuca glaucescens]